MKKITLLLSLSTAFSFAQTLGITSYATGFNTPVEIVNAGDNRLFVVQKGGSIRIVKPSGTVGIVSINDFLTLTTETIITGSERGLLGLAFHPNYSDNGFFYVNYTRAGDGATVVARYSVTAENEDIADPNSGQVMLVVPQPFANHNGGTLRFGPDGLLYIGMGDGGSGGDPGNRAQDINEDLGKMIRLDVNIPFPHFPATNPFAGEIPGNDGIWALGLRNPWKFSFNRLNGDLWIADVGQDSVEEVNKISAPVPAGLNFGWRCYEGTAPFNLTGCGPASNYTFPLADYTQAASGGCSVTGGYYYTGSAYPNLIGTYIFGDYCLGKLMSMTDSGTIIMTPTLTGLSAVTSFGEDNDGELYVASAGNGVIYKIIDTALGTAGFAENGLSMYPNPATSELFIKNSNETGLALFSMYDLSGKLLMEQKLNDIEVNAIPTGNIQTGLYLVTIQDASGSRFNSKVAIK